MTETTLQTVLSTALKALESGDVPGARQGIAQALALAQEPAAGYLARFPSGRWGILFDPPPIELPAGTFFELHWHGKWTQARIEHGDQGDYAVGFPPLQKGIICRMPAR